MLKTLRLTNIVLVNTAEIVFEKGLNILSGETGSGKSAVMEAIKQLTGARGDSGLVRHGEEKGVIEAAFDISAQSKVRDILLSAGIDHDDTEELIIRREIFAAGKSRAFVNNQLAQVTLLKHLGPALIEIVGQHAGLKLLSLEEQREILDVFGDLVPLRELFETALQKEMEIDFELQKLMREEAGRLREINTLQKEISELDEASVKEGEEEALFSEYTRFTHAEEIAGKSRQIYETLCGDNEALLPPLKQLVRIFDEARELDPSLDETAKMFQAALIDLEEAAFSVQGYLARIEFQPEKAAEINDRLSLIHQIKRKYGGTYEEISNYYEKAVNRLNRLENADVCIEEMKKELVKLQMKTESLGSELSQKRIKAAKRFEQDMLTQIRSLNMPKAEFTVSISKQSRTRSGDDRVEFHFTPNVGESRVSVKECASGGELSRLLLAVQTLLADKEHVPTLVFDEIDANIGGETAKIVGQKLEEIGKKHQVVCITHFAQVAKFAHHHMRIAKKEKAGRTFTEVETLGPGKREQELVRMQGK